MPSRQVDAFLMPELVVLFVSLDGNEDISDDDDDDDDDEFEGRYDRKQNTRDADDLQQSLRQRLATNQSVFFTTHDKNVIHLQFM